MSVFLFVPGDNGKRIVKALNSEADTVIIDLEDGVIPNKKVLARNTIIDTLKENPRLFSDKKLWLRINPEHTPWHDEDLLLINQIPSLDGIMLPKCETAYNIRSIENRLSLDLEIVPLIETASGILHTQQLIDSSRWVKRVAFGSVDFAYDIGAEWTPSGIERRYAMSQIVVLSRAAEGEPPIDAVFPQIDDEESFKKDTLIGKQVGFFGKLVIHPKQAQWVNEIYSPSKEEIDWYRKVVEIYEESDDKGAVALDGKLIDLPVYLLARRYLETSK
ncbi:HpcH/HpaI aldolase/citrate lyase family protein [Virgibacillus sediminis]|uniref:HpcH/HpaI aldolase/citrate lyase family protein n=1 Tax=Virgibacillus sediminis TaxID=202260 RepID=A0ABV7A7X2_9BACI